MPSVVSHHPSDISRLKKSVPLSPARCITFAAVAATLLTLGCTDASIVPLSLNRSVALANNVRKDSGEIRKFAYATEQSGKGHWTKSQKKVHFLPAKSPLSSRRKSTFFPGAEKQTGKSNEVKALTIV